LVSLAIGRIRIVCKKSYHFAMKIYLERTLPTCPSKLKCVACNNSFAAERIRALLSRENGLLQGDICPSCLKLGASRMEKRLKSAAAEIMQQERKESLCIDQYRTALEQFEAAEEGIKMPRFYHWWLKHLEIISQETQELEKARLGLSQCQCGKPRSQFRITFQEEES